MNNSQKIESLNSIRNEMSHLWGSAFVVGGGSLTFVIYEPSPIKLILSCFGLLATIILMNTYIKRRTELLKLIGDLED